MKYGISLGLFGLLAGLSLGCGNSTVATKSAEVGPDAPGAETDEEALKGLAGNWRVVSIQNLPPGYSADAKHLTARIEGKVIELSEGFGYFDRGEIRLAPAKSPKQFDLISLDKAGKPRTIKFFTTGGPNAGKEQEHPVEPVQGIYNLKGDQLTIAITDRDGYRPTEFKPSVMENTGPPVTVNRRGATYVVIVELTRAKGEASGPDESSPEGVARWFLEAFRSRNLDGVLMVSAAPFLIELDNPKTARVIEKSGDLKAELQKLMDGWPKLEEFPMGIVEFGEGRGKGLSPEKLEKLKKLNDPQNKVRDYGGHYVIPRIAVGPDKGGRAKMKLLLKDVGGKPRVVGLVTGDGSSPD